MVSDFSIVQFTPATTPKIGEPVCTTLIENKGETGTLAAGIIDNLTGQLIGWGETIELPQGKQTKVDMVVTGDIKSPNLGFIVGYVENGEFKITDKMDFQVALVPAVPSPYNVLIPIGILLMIVIGLYIIKKSSTK